MVLPSVSGRRREREDDEGERGHPEQFVDWPSPSIRLRCEAALGPPKKWKEMNVKKGLMTIRASTTNLKVKKETRKLTKTTPVQVPRPVCVEQVVSERSRDGNTA
jgi:hypothetical protein